MLPTCLYKVSPDLTGKAFRRSTHLRNLYELYLMIERIHSFAVLFPLYFIILSYIIHHVFLTHYTSYTVHHASYTMHHTFSYHTSYSVLSSVIISYPILSYSILSFQTNNILDQINKTKENKN